MMIVSALAEWGGRTTKEEDDCRRAPFDSLSGKAEIEKPRQSEQKDRGECNYVMESAATICLRAEGWNGGLLSAIRMTARFQLSVSRIQRRIGFDPFQTAEHDESLVFGCKKVTRG